MVQNKLGIPGRFETEVGKKFLNAYNHFMISPKRLRVASSNIRFANPNDGANDWPMRLPLWSKLINDFDPMIMGTQEGRRPQLLEAEESLHHLKLAQDHRNWISQRMYPCIFYNPNKIQPLRSGDAWLSETPEVAGSKSFESAFPRLCTWMEAQVIESKKNFFFVNTHLDHVKDQTRSMQIEVVIQTIQLQNTNQLPVILCGDFNEEPNGEVRRKINQILALQDPWLSLDLSEETSHHQFCGENSDGSRIDWILCDTSMKPISIELDKSHQDHLWPSDHFIVKAEIDF